MFVRRTHDAGDQEWLALRGEFIPELTLSEHREFIGAFALDSAALIGLIATNEHGDALGFAEVSVRREYVNGCQHRPALFLEGIYSRPQFRGQGVARTLCRAAEEWGLEQGCLEFASDVYLDDSNSLAAHAALGFEETERVVYFRKNLQSTPL